MKLLSERDVAAAVRRFVGSRRLFAVAFWGDGGADRLGLTPAQARKATVICNLESGACNPFEIEALKQRGARVRTNPRLHAKVYTDARTAIVGSSNASSNGLAVAQADATGWIEASLLTTDGTLVGEVVDWFETLWTAPESTAVTAARLEAAKTRWALRPPPPPTGAARARGGLLDRCRRSPELFKDVYVAFYDQGLSTEAAAALRELKRGGGPVPGLSRKDFSDVGAYEGWGDVFRDGAWLVDVDLRPALKRPRVTTHKVHDPVVSLPFLDLVLCVARRIRLPGEAKPLSITKLDRERFATFGRRKLKSGSGGVLLPLVKVAASASMSDDQPGSRH